MHSTLVKRGGAAVPIWFVDQASWPGLRAQFDEKARLSPMRPGSSQSRAGMSCFPMQRAVSPRCCSAATRRRRPGAIRFLPGGCPACCRAASIALPMPRRRRGLRRSPLRSAPTVSAATARSRQKRCASKSPTGSTATSSRASSRRCISRATSSTRRPTTWGRREIETAARDLAARHGAEIAHACRRGTPRRALSRSSTRSAARPSTRRA